MAEDSGASIAYASGIASSVSQADNDTWNDIDEDNFTSADYSEDSPGTRLNLSASSGNTFYTTDLGLIESGERIATMGIDAALTASERATEAARAGLSEASRVLLEKAESDISKVLKPVGILAGIIAALIWGPGLVSAFAGGKGKKK